MRNLSVEDNKSWSYKAHFENNLPGYVSIDIYELKTINFNHSM